MRLMRNHTATISVRTVSHSGGKASVSSPETISLTNCRIEPVAGTRYIQAENGDKIVYSHRLFCNLFDEAGPDIEGQKLTFNGQSFMILRCFPYTKHVEMKLK
jgi:hypothetical protein